jgi:hypothetical protein
MQLGQINLTSSQATGVLATAAAVGALYFTSRGATGRSRATYTLATVGAAAIGVLYWVGNLVPQIEIIANVIKACIALTASACVFYEIDRIRQRRPIAERWKRFVGITLGVAAILAYFNGFQGIYAKFWHRHDQYHYYFGAKYFRELGYDGLYKCTVVAEDEIGKVTDTIDGRRYTIDLSAEARDKGRKIRNLGGDNLLKPASEFLDHPAECKAHFSDDRWAQFKRDVQFFRFSCATEKDYWQGMQRDHGYNPPPVWSLTGYLIASVHDASTGFMQFLALIDEAYFLGMFIGIFWAFGWRVFAVAAILWGCQACAPNSWTLGAFLRQDWLFWFVMAGCFARKRYFALAGASMVYAGLLRIFPGVAVIGWLVVAGAYLVRHKRLRPDHLRALLGGTAAAVVLVGASLAVVGRDSYQQFYKHTIEVHDQTPLTNHMGLRVLVGHRMECMIPGFPGCEGRASGRMKYVEDGTALDPFERWKTMRLERYAKYKPVAYGLLGLTLVVFVAVVRRIKSLWVAQALGQIWIVLLSQLTNYYYSFVIIAAPLTRVRRDLELWLFGFAALTQFIYLSFGYNDDRYTVLTLVTLIFNLFLVLSFAPKGWFARKAKAAGAAGAAAETGATSEAS